MSIGINHRMRHKASMTNLSKQTFIPDQRDVQWLSSPEYVTETPVLCNRTGALRDRGVKAGLALFL
jgi:hypothetical protein